MSADPTAWMPLYVGDYLGDTQRLTTEQHGAYLLLILDYWRNGPAPDDDDVLQQITKLDRTRWRKHRPALAKFFAVGGGEWRHKRIDAELEGAKANAERRAAKAKAAADARWGNAPSNAQGMPDALPEECPPPSPSPSPKSSSKNDRLDNTSLHPSLAFSGRVIRLNQRDFAEWGRRYYAIPDLAAELGALDDWLRDQDETLRKKWFHVVSSSLAKKHQANLSANRPDATAEGIW